MMCDEIEYNPFYSILKNTYRKKYELAVSNCWKICVPSRSTLRGIDINEEFVDIHILKPVTSSSKHFISDGCDGPYEYKIENQIITLENAPFPLEKTYTVNINLFITAHNKDFQVYEILLVDKPLSPSLYPEDYKNEHLVLLKKDITSYQKVTKFLSHFTCDELNADIKAWQKNICSKLEVLQNQVHDLISRHWVHFLQSSSLELQRDARFQKLLSVALENYIVHQIHDILFPAICLEYEEEDKAFLYHLQELAAAKVTAVQLGAPEDVSVPLPAAVVELACIDNLTCPIDKLSCLQTTLDLIHAEVKGAYLDIYSLEAGSNEVPSLDMSSLIPLLMSVIIHSKPLHMVSNLEYVNKFQWTLSPQDPMSFSLVTFNAAVKNILSVQTSNLQLQEGGVPRELGMADLIKVTVKVEKHFDRKGARIIQSPITPVDRHLERITELIGASTQESNPYHEAVETVPTYISRKNR